MQNTVLRYLMIIFLLSVYINRGFFITPYEIENHGNKEINSVAEWVYKLITGEENDLDEDGDEHSDCHSVKIVQYDFSQQMAKYLDLSNLPSHDIEKNKFSREEDFILSDFCFKIDHPPQSI